MCFQLALTALKNGHPVKRAHWTTQYVRAVRTNGDKDDLVLQMVGSTIQGFIADSEDLLANDWTIVQIKL